MCLRAQKRKGADTWYQPLYKSHIKGYDETPEDRI